MTDTDALVDRLRDLLGKATPGPWETSVDYSGRYAVACVKKAGLPACLCDWENEHDFHMIAALRNAAPALLDRIEALEREVRGWRECALYDPTVPKPTFKGWDRSALERMRKGAYR
jgi:hypothetical protein